MLDAVQLAVEQIHIVSATCQTQLNTTRDDLVIIAAVIN